MVEVFVPRRAKNNAWRSDEGVQVRLNESTLLNQVSRASIFDAEAVEGGEGTKGQVLVKC